MSTTMVERIRRLRPVPIGVEPSGDINIVPETAQSVDALNERLGFAVAPVIRQFVESLGSGFCFEYGAVELSGTEWDVAEILQFGGEGDRVVSFVEGYRGQMPLGWLPFALTSLGDVYALATTGEVYLIHLVESEWTKSTRPNSQGIRVADSFEHFVSELSQPDWVTTNT